jgi:hypothetical protein
MSHGRNVMVDGGVGVTQGIGQTLLLLAMSSNHEITLNKIVKLAKLNDGTIVLVGEEEVLGDLLEISGMHDI